MGRFFLRFSPIVVFAVVGDSMVPQVKDKDMVIGITFLPVRVRDVVIAYDPRDGRLLLKRIIKIEKNTYFLQGDNEKHSRDSRVFGSISRDQIVSKVIAKL